MHLNADDVDNVLKARHRRTSGARRLGWANPRPGNKMSGRKVRRLKSEGMWAKRTRRKARGARRKAMLKAR